MPPTVPSRTQPAGLRSSDRLLLLAFSLILLLPGIFRISLTDRDEGWYAQVSREMLADGDWLTPHYLGEAWIAKPPLLYWCVTSSYALFGTSAGAARLVSVIAAACSVQLIATLAARMFNRRVALIAAVSFITAGLPLIISKMLLTDALLLPCCLAATLTLWHIATRGARLCTAALFWLCVGLAILAKGPAVVVFVGAFGVALLVRPETRRAVFSGRLWLMSPICLIVAAPWYAYIAHHEGGALVQQFIWYEVFSRLAGTPHGHGGPPGYYLLLSLAGWLPWTALVPGAVIEMWQVRRREPSAWLLLLWCALPWLLLELIRSKLPHYILPCYVPLAIMLGYMWDRGLQQPVTPPQRTVLGIWAAVPIVMGAGLVAAAVFCRELAWSLAAGVSGAALIIGFASVAWLARKDRLLPAFRAAVGVIGVFYILAGLWLLPGFEPYRLSRLIAEQANEWSAPSLPIVVSGYEEPSTFFYLDEPARVAPPGELAARLRELEPPYLLIAADPVLADTELAPPPDSPDWQAIRGFNYVKGREEMVWVTRIDTPPQPTAIRDR